MPPFSTACTSSPLICFPPCNSICFRQIHQVRAKTYGENYQWEGEADMEGTVKVENHAQMRGSLCSKFLVWVRQLGSLK